MSDIPRLRISEKDFMALPEYSSTTPTGGKLGMRWRRHHCWRENGELKYRWLIGEWVQDEEPGYSKTQWYVPLIEKGGMYI